MSYNQRKKSKIDEYTDKEIKNKRRKTEETNNNYSIQVPKKRKKEKIIRSRYK